MKAKMNKEGKITITPEDGIEEYALDKWSSENKMSHDKIEIKTKIKSGDFGFKGKEDGKNQN